MNSRLWINISSTLACIRTGGLEKLYERIDHEFDDEKGHASRLIERILFLEGTPDMTKREDLKIGKDVPEMLENDLQLEYSVDKALKAAIKECEEEQDYQSREILEVMLADTEEDHAYWLEKQLGLIKKVGLQNYLQSPDGLRRSSLKGGKYFPPPSCQKLEFSNKRNNTLSALRRQTVYIPQL